MGLIDACLSFLGLVRQCAGNDLKQCRARVIIALIESGVEFDEDEISGLSFRAIFQSMADKLDHRRLSGTPRAGNTYGDGASSRLHDDLADCLGNTRKV